MAHYDFRFHLSSLESEYYRLEAQNFALRKALETSGGAQVCAAGEDGCEAMESMMETEASALVHIFQHDGVHATAPGEIFEEPCLADQTHETTEDTSLPSPQPAMPECGSTPHRSSDLNQWFDAETDEGEEEDEMKSPRSTLGKFRDSALNFAGASAATASYLNSRRPLFPDAQEMKEKVRSQLLRPKYDVTDYFKEKGWSQFVARHPVFEGMTLFAIALNAFWIAYDTDHNDSEVLVSADWGFQVVEHAFCAFFVLEILIRFFAFECKRNCLRDMWFVFDFILVVLTVTETWVLSLIMLAASGGPDTGVNLGDASVLRVARLMRLTRMARMARLLRAMPELVMLVKGILAAARSVFFTLLLLLCVLYVFAIAFTQLSKPLGEEIREQFFSNVIHSMNTLWLYATLLEEITTLMHAIEKESIGLVIFLDLFILIASLTIMNMLIGVLCEVINAVAASEKEEISLAFVKTKVERIFYTLGLGEACNGRISRDAFVKIVENRTAARAISDLGVDVLQLVDLADHFFENDNEDAEQDKDLSFAEFMDMVSQFRGKNVATVKDMMQLRRFLHIELNKLKRDIRVDPLQMIGPKSMSSNSLLRQTSASPSTRNASRQTSPAPPLPPALPDRCASSPSHCW